MTTKPVALILGHGPGIGASVAKKLTSNGYSVAVASRSASGGKTVEGYLSLKVDLSKPDLLPALFKAVKNELQSPPSVVIYNAAALTPPPDNGSIFSTSADAFVSDLNVNTVSPYVAAQEAVKEWKTLPKETKRTFIYTGNIMNVSVVLIPIFMTLGVGKSASAFWIGLADQLYSEQGTRFFYADERYEDGKLKGTKIDGDAHADFFTNLASHEGSVPWHATFVKDKGYVRFIP